MVTTKERITVLKQIVYRQIVRVKVILLIHMYRYIYIFINVEKQNVLNVTVKYINYSPKCYIKSVAIQLLRQCILNI